MGTPNSKITSPSGPSPGDSVPGTDLGSTSGRVVFDERGNAVWEWSSSIGAFDDESATQRLSRLENPTLALADDDSPALVARPNPLGKIKGYNPYDSGRLAKPTTMAPTKKTDLRRLSEWMKLKKQAESNKNPR